MQQQQQQNTTTAAATMKSWKKSHQHIYQQNFLLNTGQSHHFFYIQKALKRENQQKTYDEKAEIVKHFTNVWFLIQLWINTLYAMYGFILELSSHNHDQHNAEIQHTYSNSKLKYLGNSEIVFKRLQLSLFAMQALVKHKPFLHYFHNIVITVPKISVCAL